MNSESDISHHLTKAKNSDGLAISSIDVIKLKPADSYTDISKSHSHGSLITNSLETNLSSHMNKELTNKKKSKSNVPGKLIMSLESNISPLINTDLTEGIILDSLEPDLSIHINPELTEQNDSEPHLPGRPILNYLETNFNSCVNTVLTEEVIKKYLQPNFNSHTNSELIEENVSNPSLPVSLVINSPETNFSPHIHHIDVSEVNITKSYLSGSLIMDSLETDLSPHINTDLTQENMSKDLSEHNIPRELNENIIATGLNENRSAKETNEIQVDSVGYSGLITERMKKESDTAVTDLVLKGDVKTHMIPSNVNGKNNKDDMMEAHNAAISTLKCAMQDFFGKAYCHTVTAVCSACSLIQRESARMIDNFKNMLDEDAACPKEDPNDKNKKKK